MDEDRQRENELDEETAAGAKSKLEIESLEPRIMLSATWIDADTGDELDGATDADDVFTGTDADEVATGLGGSDHLFGGAGDDVLDGSAGDDVLSGGAGDDTLEGGLGRDTADYSSSPSGVQVDLTTGAASGGDGSDVLTDIEAVVGSSHDDVFAFAEPVDGGVYSVDGGGGSNSIDLSQFTRDDASFENGVLTVATGDGASFVVEHVNVDSIEFSDRTMSFVVWDGEGDASAPSDPANWSTDTAPGPDSILVFDGTFSENVAFGSDAPAIGGLQIHEGFGGTVTLESSVTIEGDVSLESGSLVAGSEGLSIAGDFVMESGRFEASSGITSFEGDLRIEGGTFQHNSAAIELTGAGDQVLAGGNTQLHDLRIEKTEGTLTVVDDVRVTGDLTHVSGTVDASAATVEFQGNGNTIDAGAITFGDVTFDGYGFTLAADLQVDGDLTLERVSSLQGGDLHIAGNLTTLDTSVGGSTVLVLDGTGDQTVSAGGGTGEVSNLRIEKASGTLTLADTVQVSGDLTHVSGDVDASAATVEFQGNGNTIDAGAITFGDVTFDGYGFTLAADLQIDGDLTLERVSSLQGGDLHIAGNLTTLDTSVGGSTVLVLDGTGDQTVSAGGGTGEVSNLRIEKASGTLTLADTVQVSGDLTHVSGDVDASAATVEFQGDGNTIDPGAITFGDVTFGGYGFTLAADLQIDGDLTLERVSSLQGGDLHIAGNLTTLDTSVGGSTVLVLDGTGDQTVSAGGGTGEVSNLRIEKASGTLTLADTVQVSGDLTHVSGAVDASAATVEFQGNGNTIDAGAITFGDVTFDGYGFTLAADLQIDGDLTLERVSSLQGGDLHIAGNLTTLDTSVGGSTVLVLDGTGDQTVSAGGGTGEVSNLRIEKASGSLTLADTVQVSGDLTHVSGAVDASAATVEFQGNGNTIDAGAITFGDVTFDGYGFTLAADLQIDGDLTLERVSSLQGGDLHIAGNLTTLDTSVGGSTVLVLDGTGDQTVSAGGGTGEVSNLRIEKASGTLTLADTVQVSGDLTHVSGDVDASAATVEFQGDGNTIDPGAITFGDVTFGGYGFTLAADLQIDGDLTLERVSSLQGGDLHIAGNLTTLDTSVGGSTVLVLDGTGDQTVSAGGGTGEVSNLRIEKASGTLTLADTVQVSGDLTHVSGDVDASAATVEFQGDGNTIDPGAITFGDVTFDGYGFTLAADLQVDGDLTLERVSRIDGDVIRVSGQVHQLDSSFGGTTTVLQIPSLTLAEDTSITTGDVLDLVTDPDGGSHTIGGHTQPQHGEVLDNGDGTFTYTPDPNFHGTDSFSYDLVDEAGNLETVTVPIDVLLEPLTLDELLALTPDEIEALSSEHVAGLTPEQIEALDSYQTLALATGHTETLTVDQLNAIGHDRVGYVDMERLSPDQLAGLDAEHLNDLRENQFADMSADQLATLTPERIAELDSYRSLFLAQQQTENLTVDQLNAIGHGRVGYVDMERLSPDQLAGLDAEHLNDLRENQFADMSADQLATLTPERIAELDSYRSLFLAQQQTESLTVDQLNAIGHGRVGYADMERLSADQLAGLDAEHLNDLRENQFADMSADQLATLTPERIAELDSYRSLFLAQQQTENLTVDQLNAIGHGRVGYADMERLSADQLAGLDAEHLNDLRENQFADMSADQLATLTPERIAELDSYRSLFLAQQQTESLTVDQLNAIGHGRVGYADMERLSADQLAGLDAEHLNDLRENQFADMSADQLATLTPERIAELDSYRSLFLAQQQTENLTVDQLNAIGHGRVGYADMERLGADQLAGLDAEHLNDLRRPQFAALDADQLETFSPARILTLDHYRLLFLLEEQGDHLSVDQLAAVHEGLGSETVAPFVDAGPALTVDEGEHVTLEGAAADPDHDVLTYEWVQTGGPAVALSDPGSARPSFTAPEGLSNTDVTFELRVSDGTHVSVDTVTITVEADDDAPQASASAPESVTEGDAVVLAGQGLDPEGQTLTYEWVQTAGPPVALDDPTAAEASFSSNGVVGEVAFELRVSDGENVSVATVSVDILPAAVPDEPSAPRPAEGGVTADNALRTGAIPSGESEPLDAAPEHAGQRAETLPVEEVEERGDYEAPGVHALDLPQPALAASDVLDAGTLTDAASFSELFREVPSETGGALAPWEIASRSADAAVATERSSSPDPVADVPQREAREPDVSEAGESGARFSPTRLWAGLWGLLRAKSGVASVRAGDSETKGPKD